MVGEADKIHLAKLLPVVVDGLAVHHPQVDAKFVHGLDFATILALTLAHLIKVVREHLVPGIYVKLFFSSAPSFYDILGLVVI